jgi:hypothetical protein
VVYEEAGGFRLPLDDGHELPSEPWERDIFEIHDEDPQVPAPSPSVAPPVAGELVHAGRRGWRDDVRHRRFPRDHLGGGLGGFGADLHQGVVI